MTFRRRQRGVALLVALLVVALATILIALLLDRGELAFARTRNALRGEQAAAYAQGLEEYAAVVLLRAQDQGADSSLSAWATPLPPQPVAGGVIGATMRDLNGCFNLNNLSPRVGSRRGAWAAAFERLLGAAGVGDARIAGAVQAWLDDSGAANDTNAYLAQPLPYRPRRGLFAHASELRLVAGVGADAYARLAPHVCALPPGTRINVNTADVAVLASLDEAISPALAQKLWNGGQANFGSREEFARAVPGAPALANSPLIDVASDYFLVRGEIALDGIAFVSRSLIERGRDGIRVLERSSGSDDMADPADDEALRIARDANLD